MVGKPGRSGRPKGSTSRSASRLKKPVNRAAHYLAVLTEMWLAGGLIQIGPDKWLPQPTKRERHVPPLWIRRVLAKCAIAHDEHIRAETKALHLRGLLPKMFTVNHEPTPRVKVSEVRKVHRRRAPASTLRRRRNKCDQKK
jgi:hypothetical protein